jgi:DNA-binding NarL/FixJ family response regulator
MREIEVVQLVAAGLSNDAIAARLFISPRTAQSHVANAIRKTSCSNRTELGVLAIREGLVPLEEGAVPPLQSADARGGSTAASTA